MAKGLDFTAETLRAAYDYLVTTPPFRSWGLPDSDDVRFKVGRFRSHCAHYQWDGKQHTITASINAIGHTDTLFRKMAHEIVHLHLEELGMDSRGTANTHSGAFRRLAADVCDVHGWDVKVFY
jgi:hypothetical protein